MAKTLRTIKPKSSQERYSFYSEKKKMLPSVHFSEVDFPEIDKWQIGEKYRVEMVIEMKSKDEQTGGFDIHQFGATPERVKRKRS